MIAPQQLKAEPAKPWVSQPGLWQRYAAGGHGHDSEDELVREYLPLVQSVVGRLAITLPPHLNRDDLYSAGLVGLLQAVRNYNPRIGTAFEPYARTRIRGAVLDELRRSDWIPRSIHAKARKVQNAMRDLEQKTGSLPTDEQMARALKLSLSEYHQLLDEIRPATFICLDAVTNPAGDDEQTEHDFLADHSQPDPQERATRSELASLIAKRLEQLPDLQRKVIALIYYEDLRLSEIAAATGFSESHICQVHTKAILAVRAYLDRCDRLTATGLPRS